MGIYLAADYHSCSLCHLPKEVSLDKDGSESVSGSINEGNDEETEIASFTDEDDLSSHSSPTVSSSVFYSSRESHSQHEKIGLESANGGIRRLGLSLPSDGTSVGVNFVAERKRRTEKKIKKFCE
ncbi:hypothetical protein ERO13_D11G173750v2 [Gossypium hirsutum]|uniref:Uncharacterized protein n=2 Tax=Gossypium TaxID=3633 RepID=A0A1U8K178_GOSHI|nr:uncharacterized protein LOC107911409 [Gossypium hirsutum]KAG4120931.1 hypothetical protein ERO13_D11G173750v2 [Gossypium hirsutum]KJB43133.1 hypothetical protein B456_007G186100 [Gossypium raimondii]